MIVEKISYEFSKDMRIVRFIWIKVGNKDGWVYYFISVFYNNISNEFVI